MFSPLTLNLFDPLNDVWFGIVFNSDLDLGTDRYGLGFTNGYEFRSSDSKLRLSVP